MSKKLDYRNKVILAPMVRIGTLPTRLLALQYGADLVYTEEIIDHKIVGATKIKNEILGTTDYVLSDETLVFRVHPSEKDRLIFQLGTADAATALKAARRVEHEVSGIDVNMGCPKEFSLKGGMGAALLKKPDKIKEILTTLVSSLSVPVTCKIRLLPEMEQNIALVKMIESCGVAAVAIHGRLTEERPRHPVRTDAIKHLAQILSIPVIANGGSKEIKCYEDILKFRDAAGTASVMVARSAEYNLSVFRREGVKPVTEVVKDYLKVAIDMDNGFTNTKYNILMTMHADMDLQLGLDTQDAKSFEEICEIWGMKDYMEKVNAERQSKQKMVDKYRGIKRRKTEDGKILIEMPIRFIKKDYSTGVSPKLKLYNWTQQNKVDKPIYITVDRPEDRLFNCTMELDGKKFKTSIWEKSKQLAEQAACIVGLIVLGEDDGRKPDSVSPNDDVARAWREEFNGGGSEEKELYRHKHGGHLEIGETESCNAGSNDTVNCIGDMQNSDCGSGEIKNCDGGRGETHTCNDGCSGTQNCIAKGNNGEAASDDHRVCNMYKRSINEKTTDCSVTVGETNTDGVVNCASPADYKDRCHGDNKMVINNGGGDVGDNIITEASSDSHVILQKNQSADS